MKITEAFPSKYLKTSDLQGQRRKLVIASVTMESVSQDPNEPDKPILYFKGAKKGFVLNKTNCMTLANFFGDETDEWINNPVVLVPSKTPYQGKLVDCVRIEAAPAVTVDARKATPPALPDSDELGGDDDIPF